MSVFKSTNKPAPAEAGTNSVKKLNLHTMRWDKKHLKIAASVVNIVRRFSVVLTISKHIGLFTERNHFAVMTVGNVISKNGILTHICALALERNRTSVSIVEIAFLRKLT